MISKDKKIQQIQNQICELNKELILLKKENEKISPKVNNSKNIKNEKYLNQKVDDVDMWKRLIIFSFFILAVGISFLAIGLTAPLGILALGPLLAFPIVSLGMGVPLFIASSFKIVSNFFKTKINKKNKYKKIISIKNSKKPKIEHNFKNTNLNVQEINSIDLQNQLSTNGCKSLTSKSPKM